MKKYAVYAAVVALLALSASGCKELLQTQVNFRNDSAAKTVYAVWDGVRQQDLAPGESSPFQNVNPGTHTIQWKNAATGKDLTTVAWPNLVQGEGYTFPYKD